MSIIGKAPRLVLDFEMYQSDFSKKDDGELSYSKEIVRKISKRA